MGKALKIVGAVVAIAGLAIITAGAGLVLASGGTLGAALSAGLASGIGVSVGTMMTAAAVLTTAGSLLAPRPKAPAVSNGIAERLQASINPRANRTFVFGSTAMSTDIRDQEFTNNQEYLHRFIVAASHRAQAIREIWFDDKLAWTLAGGVQGEFAGYLTVAIRLEGTPANAINISSRMGSSRRFTGCAYVHLRYKLTGNSKKAESPFAQSVPSRMTIVGDGIPVYDPRKDSTRGGSGSHRADDQSTWEWHPDAARNPPLVLLTWLLGWRIRNPSTGVWKLAVGKGLPPARIDFDSFIAAANLCDEPVAKAGGGTEPRYRVDGVISEGDGLETMLDNIKASCNAIVDDLGGRIRIQVLHNDLAVPQGSLTTHDVLGAFTWSQTPPLQDTVNILTGSFTDPSANSLYQLIPLPFELKIPSPDGIDRPQHVPLAFVQSVSQAKRLLVLRLQRALYPGTFQAVFQATAWRFQKGDVIRFSFAPLGWTNKLFRIVDMAVQVDGTVPMLLREEHPDNYLADGTDAVSVIAAEPTRYDPLMGSIVQAIGDAGQTAEWPQISDPDGTKPDDNATNSGDPASPFGLEGTVADALGRVSAAEQDVIDLTGGLSAQQLRHAQLERAVESADRQRILAEETLSSAIGRALLEADRTRRVFRDAGVTVDPESGEVRLWALDQTRDRVSNVELGLTAALAQISLRATTSYVNQAIAEAVIDPGQIAELGEIFTRLTAAEIQLNGLGAAIALKADATTVTALAGTVTTVAADLDALAGVVALKASSARVTALDTRLSDVEVTITAIGNVSSVRTELRQARYESDAHAENLLRSLLEGDKNRRGALSALATARQELTAKINDDLSVEAAQRLALAVRLAANEAGLIAEQITRATADSATSASLTALTASVAGLSAELDAAVTQLLSAITDETSARAAALLSLSTSIDGQIGVLQASLSALAEAITDETGARTAQYTALNARVGTVESSITEVSEVAVSAQGIAKAIRGVLLDANGKIAGWSSEIDGDISAFRIRSDVFEVSDGTGRGLIFSAGSLKLVNEAGNKIVEMGEM